MYCGYFRVLRGRKLKNPQQRALATGYRWLKTRLTTATEDMAQGQPA